MRRSRLWLALALCWPATATADVRLDELRGTMMELRGGSLSAGPRGATPRLTVAKHELRDWIEPRLKDIHSSPGDDARLAAALNEELQQAGLLCDWSVPELRTCPGQTYLGFLKRVQFHWSRGFLILETWMGIECGFDESAYLYARSDEGWRRVWQAEQNIYTDKEYKPQSIKAVLVSPYSRANDYLLLTLGTGFGCASAWHNVYYRAFRLGPDQQAGPLLDEEELADVARDPPIDGSIDRTDVLVQFSGHSIDPTILVRLFVRHYRIEADGVERIDPLALRPRDFVDEWLTHEWREAADWSESENRCSMADSHAKLHKDPLFAEFMYPTMHCPDAPDLWQVGAAFGDPQAPQTRVFFLVRWTPPYEFRMADVRDQPAPECTEEDRKADDERRTLFPERDWH